MKSTQVYRSERQLHIAGLSGLSICISGLQTERNQKLEKSAESIRNVPPQES